MKQFKKLLCTVMLALGMTCLAGCSSKDKDSNNELFTAKVLEVREDSILVEEIMDEGKAGQYTFGIKDLKDSDKIMVNDIITVYFTGGIRETEPAQIDVTKWELVKRPEAADITNGQTNFGKGFGGQYGLLRENRVDINIEGKWSSFAYNENNLEGVNMEVVSNTNHSLKLIIQKENKQEVECGEEYSIEQFDKKSGSWTGVNYISDDVSFDAVSYTLNQDQKEFDIDWNCYMESWKKGNIESLRNL